MPEDISVNEPVSDDELIKSSQESLVDFLKQNYDITEPRIEDAFLSVPRHLFLPGVEIEKVYQDEAIVTQTTDGHPTSSCSQPVIVARLLALLDAALGDNILEIGAGTGWAAGLVGHIVGQGGRVTTVDISEEVAAGARAHLARNGSSNVEVIAGDGGLGYPQNGPYDAIIATVGIWDITPQWLAQLKVGGKIVLPFWLNTLQFGAAFQKVDSNNSLILTAHCGTLGFMRLRGAFAGLDSYYYKDDYRIDSEITDEETLKDVIALVNGGGRLVEFPLAQTGRDRQFLTQYLALTNQPVVGLMDWKNRHGFAFGNGIIEGNSLAILPTHRDEGELPEKIVVFGGSEALDRLQMLAEHWHSLGQPTLWQVRIRAEPVTAHPLEPGVNVFRKRWMQYEVSFNPQPAYERPGIARPEA